MIFCSQKLSIQILIALQKNRTDRLVDIQIENILTETNNYRVALLLNIQEIIWESVKIYQFKKF